jgi:hypothetical protein
MYMWMFVVSYLLIGALLSYILVQTSPDQLRWVANIGMDVLLVGIFVIYCRNIHLKSVSFFDLAKRRLLVLNFISLNRTSTCLSGFVYRKDNFLDFQQS